MGIRYSKEEMDQIQSLVAEGLTSREIASKLGRPEAGIRNIRYRLNLRRRLEDNITSLNKQQKDLQSKINELEKTIEHLTNEIEILEKKKEQYKSLLNSNKESIKKMMEDHLIELKKEKPELFSITEEEQIAKLVGNFVKWLIS